MSDKTKRVIWQVVASIQDRQWPVSVETEIPASSIQQMNEAMESVALWFLKNNIYPQKLAATPSTERAPEEGAKMPEKDAVPLADPPECPHCKKGMTLSKHQQAETEISYYCPTRFGTGSYCKWRGFVDPITQETDTWQVQDKKESK